MVQTCETEAEQSSSDLTEPGKPGALWVMIYSSILCIDVSDPEVEMEKIL